MSIGEALKNWGHDALAAIEVVDSREPNDTPEVRPGNEWYHQLEEQTVEGVTFYKIEDSNGNYDWYPKVDVMQSYFEDQIAALNVEMAPIKRKIEMYNSEIRRIEAYLRGERIEGLADEQAELTVTSEIEQAQAEFNYAQSKYTENDTMYLIAKSNLDKALMKMSKKTAQDEEIFHITSWPPKPGAAPEANQNLYSLKSQHRIEIRRIEDVELEPLEDQRDLNQDHLDYWKDQVENFYEEYEA